jgi:hypothetical protein
MNKPILVIDDKLGRLQARRENIILEGYNDFVTFSSSIDFVSFDGAVNAKIVSDMTGVECIFIHSSINTGTMLPASSIAKIRLVVSPVLVIEFSGGSETRLDQFKLSYDDFERGFLLFVRIYADYGISFLRAFTGSGLKELAAFFRDESNRLLQEPYTLLPLQVSQTLYFKGLLKIAGVTYQDFLDRYNPTFMKPIELAKLCIQLSR